MRRRGEARSARPALSGDAVGVTVKNGADRARRAAKGVRVDERVERLADARRISARTMSKIKTNYAGIVGVNTLLILLGLAGRVTPRTSAILHNLTTLLACGRALSPVLKKQP